jgi:predicted amidohydrolase YtcJ
MDKFHRAVGFFARHGFQIATHACGDRAVRETLDAYKKAGAGPGIRHRIEHVEAVSADDVPRFRAEGVVASMQPQHMMWLEPDRSDNYSRRLGPGRSRRLFPLRELVQAGASVVLGSDWPVASCDWREGMAAAQLRRPPGQRDRAAYDDQAIDALTALEGYTTRPADAVGDHDLGPLRVGRLADVTVLAEDPIDVTPDELVDVPVVLTVVGGEIVHRLGDR